MLGAGNREDGPQAVVHLPDLVLVAEAVLGSSADISDLHLIGYHQPDIQRLTVTFAFCTPVPRVSPQP